MQPQHSHKWIEEDFLIYSNTKMGITVDFPKEWIKYEQRKDNATVVSFYENDPYSDHASKSVTCLSITMLDLSKENSLPLCSQSQATLEEYTAVALQQMKSVMDNLSELKLSDCKLSNIEAKKLEFTKKNSFHPAMKQNFVQCWTIKNNIAYILAFNTTASQYSTHASILEHCIKSFTFTKPIPSGTLLTDVSKLFNNPELADITFIVEGKPVYANKALLAVRSEHFRAMLFGGLKESNAKEIVISDISYKVFYALIEYLYIDDVKVTHDIALQLLVLADSYMLERLKTKCEYIMCESVTVENSCSLLVAAKQYGADQLTRHCLRFIKKHKDQVKSTKSFSELSSNSEILLELLFEFMTD